MEYVVLKRCIILFLSSCLLIGCGSTTVRESTGEYLDSTAVTTKVKARLFDMLGSDAFSIKVKTYKDWVQLSGFVNSETVKRRAGIIADNTIGVKYVRNDLIVKRVPVQTTNQPPAWQFQ
jgi:osmotically-inducible protein OsmY